MPHLGDQLSAYVDRRMSAAVLYGWDRHVMICAVCRARVDEERRLLESLRSAPAPGMSAELQAMLLSLADGGVLDGSPAVTGPLGGRGRVPSAAQPIPVIPLAPPAARPDAATGSSVPALPALHRSLRRSLVLATLAAGASASAAWTLGLSQPNVAASDRVEPARVADRAQAQNPGTAWLGLAPGAWPTRGVLQSVVYQPVRRASR